MDISQIEEQFTEIEQLVIEVECLLKTTADSCENNDLTTQKLPLRLACEKHNNML